MKPRRPDPPYINQLEPHELKELREVEGNLTYHKQWVNLLSTVRRRIITKARTRSYYRRPPA